MGRNSGFQPDFAQTVRIRAVGGAHHEDNVHQLAEFTQGHLAILCRVADVLGARPDNVRKFPIKRRDDAFCVVDRQCRLRDVGDRGLRRQVERLNFLLVLHQQHLAGDLPERALDFRMAGMADQDDGAALAQVMAALGVHLGDQGACRVQDVEAALLGVQFDLLGDAMGGKDCDAVRRNFRQILDKSRAARLQRVDHPLVVDDLVPDIDGWAVFLERTLDDLDGANHAGAKAAWLRENDLHRMAP